MNLIEAREEVRGESYPGVSDYPQVVKTQALMKYTRTPAQESRLCVGGKVILVVNDEGLAEYRYLHPDGHIGAVED